MNKFSSIERFTQLVYELKSKYHFTGLDSNGNPIYDKNRPLPILDFKGTVKVHGTNVGITYNVQKNKFYPQSRERVLDIMQDNVGFANYYYKPKVKEYIDNILSREILNSHLTDVQYITLYGEWVGKGIQKGVAVSNLEKSFICFGLGCKRINDEKNTYLSINHIRTNKEINFYNVNDFGTFDIKIDFNNLEQTITKLEELTKQVEESCPVGKYFGFEGYGEGIVWQCTEDLSLKFKVTGEKHKKVKGSGVEIDPVKQASIDDFINYAVTENRLLQGIEKVFTENNKTTDIKSTGDFVKWVSCDVLKEEILTLQASELEWKDVGKQVSKYASKWFINFLKNNT